MPLDVIEKVYDYIREAGASPAYMSNFKTMNERKIYDIKNVDVNYSKKVIASNMEEALIKYKKYLEKRISADYSYEKIFDDIKSCTFEGFYKEDEYIM